MELDLQQLERELTPVMGVGGPLLPAIQALFANIREVISKYTCENKDAILAMAKTVYDKICAATDIPTVPEALELKLEQVLWNSWVEPTIKKIVEKHCG